MIVSGEQQRNLAIHIHGFILPQTPLPSSLPHNIELSPSRFLLVIYFKYNSVEYTFFFFFGQAACGILVPQPVIKPSLLHWQYKVLTTGPPGKSQLSLLLFSSNALSVVGAVAHF